MRGRSAVVLCLRAADFSDAGDEQARFGVQPFGEPPMAGHGEDEAQQNAETSDNADNGVAAHKSAT